MVLLQYLEESKIFMLDTLKFSLDQNYIAAIKFYLVKRFSNIKKGVHSQFFYKYKNILHFILKCRYKF